MKLWTDALRWFDKDKDELHDGNAAVGQEESQRYQDVHPKKKKRTIHYKLDKDETFLYYWKQKLFLQPFEDSAEAEETDVYKNFCNNTQDFLR